MQRDTVPGHNKAAGQGVGLGLDSGIVSDTAQVRTAVAEDTGWVDRIVQGAYCWVGVFCWTDTSCGWFGY